MVPLRSIGANTLAWAYPYIKNTQRFSPPTTLHELNVTLHHMQSFHHSIQLITSFPESFLSLLISIFYFFFRSPPAFDSPLILRHPAPSRRQERETTDTRYSCIADVFRRTLHFCLFSPPPTTTTLSPGGVFTFSLSSTNDSTTSN